MTSWSFSSIPCIITLQHTLNGWLEGNPIYKTISILEVGKNPNKDPMFDLKFKWVFLNSFSHVESWVWPHWANTEQSNINFIPFFFVTWPAQCPFCFNPFPCFYTWRGGYLKTVPRKLLFHGHCRPADTAICIMFSRLISDSAFCSFKRILVSGWSLSTIFGIKCSKWNNTLTREHREEFVEVFLLTENKCLLCILEFGTNVIYFRYKWSRIRHFCFSCVWRKAFVLLSTPKFMSFGTIKSFL